MKYYQNLQVFSELPSQIKWINHWFSGHWYFFCWVWFILSIFIQK